MAKKKKSVKRDAKEAARFRLALAHARLSQMGASRVLKMGDRTIRAYALGERVAHLTVYYSLAYIAANPHLAGDDLLSD